MFKRMKPTWHQHKCEDALQKFSMLYGVHDASENIQDYYKEEYLQFSRFIQGIFISRHGWIVDTGNFQTVNYQLMFDILYKIKKHPLLWRLFFMVA